MKIAFEKKINNLTVTLDIRDINNIRVNSVSSDSHARVKKPNTIVLKNII